MDRTKERISDNQAGFTLVELIVAAGLFAVVMLISVGALLSLVDANRKAQSLQSVMNNLNVTLDGMVRSIRMGTAYHCGPNNLTVPRDCGSTADDDNNHYRLAFTTFDGERWIYRYARDENGIGRIYRSTTGSIQDEVAVTAPEVNIDHMKFYVVGTTRGIDQLPDNPVQPKVVIEIRGTAGAHDEKIRTTFSIQATAVQRILDL